MRTHGLSGELVVESLTDFPERFSPGKVLQARFPGGSDREVPRVREVRVKASRPHSGRFLVLFDGVNGIEGEEGADALRGADLCVLPGDEPPRPPGYWFGFELEGLSVLDRSGRELGRVRGLSEAGGRALLVVQTPRGPRDVPFCEPIVVSVDPSRRCLVLDPPRGLLD